jgi:hypothetical protein
VSKEERTEEVKKREDKKRAVQIRISRKKKRDSQNNVKREG